MADRRVHAILPSGAQIVRYERAGKWFLEEIDGGQVPIKFDMAVFWGALAYQSAKGRVFFGLPGGSRFDADVKR